MDIITLSQYLASFMLIVSFALMIWGLYYNKKQADIKTLTEQMLKELKEIKEFLKKEQEGK